jgi:hypothetical protein
MDVPRCALFRRRIYRPEMRSIGLCALQQCDLTQSWIGGLKRVQKILQHRHVDRCVFWIEPPTNQIFAFEESAVNNGSNIPKRSQLLTALRIDQINRDMLCEATGLYFAPREADDVPAKLGAARNYRPSS